MNFEAPVGKNKVEAAQKFARRIVAGAVVATSILAADEEASAQKLRGSKSSMQAQAKEAQEHHYSLVKNKEQILHMVEGGYLVPVNDNEDYKLIGVTFPYARPETKLFIGRFARQYRQACGEQLIITSLVRPQNAQPRNASKLSVHPAGMAVDIRIPSKASCQKFIEKNALTIESSIFNGKKILDVTREKHPPHYHIAVFPEYKEYVAQKTKGK